MVPELRFVVHDPEELVREHEQNLRHARALVPIVVALEQLAEVRLVVERAWDTRCFQLNALVVMIFAEGPSQGTALELRFAEGEREGLERFVDEARSPLEVELDALPSLESERPSAPVDEEDAPSDAHFDDHQRLDPKIVRIRKLGLSERLRVARDGSLEDRVMLERCFGKSVWEDLLRNPGITAPEVARIANKGTAPRPLLEHIVENAAWSRQPIVRRALLGNPRVSQESAAKLLRGMSKPELKLLVQGGGYPLAVRMLAKKLASD